MRPLIGQIKIKGKLFEQRKFMNIFWSKLHKNISITQDCSKILINLLCALFVDGKCYKWFTKKI